MEEKITRLHIGSGGIYLKGYINIDKDERYKPDLIANAQYLRDYFPLESISEILIIHTIGYLSRRQAIMFMEDCYQLLIPGGELIIETPDLEKIMRLYPTDKLNYTRSIFGFDIEDDDQGKYFETHKWAWTEASLIRVLTGIGFQTRIEVPTRHNKIRDTRIVAIKPKEK